MRKLLILSFVLNLFFIFHSVGQGGPVPPPDNTPIDGGVFALVIAGAAYGYRKVVKHKKKEA